MNQEVSRDGSRPGDLFPFTLTRPLADVRIGILTLGEKWSMYRSLLGPSHAELSIPLPILPSFDLIDAINRGDGDQALANAKRLDYPWQIFQCNGEQIRNDFRLVTGNRKSAPISRTNQIIAPENIFLEEGAKVECCLLNASEGPIYIGKGAEIMEGACIRGPFSLGEGAVVKMGARIYGSTTVGPYSVVGGEIKNSVIFGYSNKAHDGYLGDSVIGEWCNLGAGTSNSNLKNNVSDVKVWVDSEEQFVNAGMKCGLLMGDYSRSAINTSFNTGTVTGVCCHIFGNGLTSKYIPSFTWGNEKVIYEFEKAIQDIRSWKKLKNQILSVSEIQTLKHIFEQL